MQNRMTWVLGAIAAAATVAAVGVGLNGYKNNPPSRQAVVQDAGTSEGENDDPLAPRFLDSTESIRVHVAGAVRKPGVYSIPAWYRVVDAVKKAGGASANADLDRINLADGLKDKEQLRIPAKGAASTVLAHAPTPEPPPIREDAGGHGMGRYPFAARPVRSERTVRLASATRPVNLNRASREELDTLPGVGPSTADRIIAYRENQGPFLQPEDLMNVKGIGPTRFAKLRPLVVAP